MLTSTLILAIGIGSPTVDRGEGEAAIPVPTYQSPPYSMARSERTRAGLLVVVLVGPGGREVRHPRVRVDQFDGRSFEFRAVRHSDSGLPQTMVIPLFREQ